MTINEIKQYMKKNGITQLHLAEKSGIPIGTIRDIFRGATKNPRIDTINAITKTLNIEENNLLPQSLQPTLETVFDSIKKLPPEKQQAIITIVNDILKFAN